MIDNVQILDRDDKDNDNNNNDNHSTITKKKTTTKTLPWACGLRHVTVCYYEHCLVVTQSGVQMGQRAIKYKIIFFISIL